jgi:tetratricopeptide (TPR) repeat protein
MDETLEDFPRDEKLFYALAIVFRNVGQYDNLVAALQELRKMDREFPIQNVFSTLQPCDRAIRVLEEVVRRMPDEPQTRLTLGIRYNNCGRTKDALKLFSDARRKFPEEKIFPLLIDKLRSGKDLADGLNPYENIKPLTPGN